MAKIALYFDDVIGARTSIPDWPIHYDTVQLFEFNLEVTAELFSLFVFLFSLRLFGSRAWVIFKLSYCNSKMLTPYLNDKGTPS